VEAAPGRGFERVFERGERRAILHVRGECGKYFRHAADEFGQLKTREGARDANESVQFGGWEVSFSGESRNEERADLIGAVDIENPSLLEQNPRKEIMGEALNFGTTVKHAERLIGQDPRA
jgi:hypothetical protein